MQESTSSTALEFRGRAGELFLIMLTNLFLTAITLGIYYPWARTKSRQFVWQNTWVGADVLRYHGTGKELAVGYLKAILVYICAAALNYFLQKAIGPGASTIVFTLLILGLIPVAVVGAVRYIRSRTSLRNIRFGFTGKPLEFAKVFLSGYLLLILTLGLYYPFFMFRMNKFFYDNSTFGNMPLTFTGNKWEYAKISYVNFILTILTLGIFTPWAIARTSNYTLGHVQSADGRVKLNAQLKGKDLFILFLVQLFALPLTLGLAFPFIQVMALKIVCRSITVEGVIPFHELRSPDSDTTQTDAMADFLSLEMPV